MCRNSCTECKRKIFSDSVSIVTIDGVDTLVVNVPAQTFNNCQRGCIVLIQSIPTAATISTPVAISIGGDTTTVYPMADCNCNQITACALRTRVRYPFKIVTNSLGGTFKILKNLSCSPNNAVSSIPVTT